MVEHIDSEVISCGLTMREFVLFTGTLQDLHHMLRSEKFGWEEIKNHSPITQAVIHYSEKMEKAADCSCPVVYSSLLDGYTSGKPRDVAKLLNAAIIDENREVVTDQIMLLLFALIDDMKPF